MQTYTASDRQKLYVKVTGQGPAVVFLHAWTSSHREWLHCAAGLANEYRCFCWDARGHGGHALTVEGEPSVGRMADDLQDLIHHFQLEKPLLLGHSMGALTIWEYIRRYGCDNIGKLCFVDQSPKLITDREWKHGVYGDFSKSRNQEFVALLEQDFVEAVLRLVAESNNPRARKGYAGNSVEFQRMRKSIRSLDPAPLISVWKSLCLADYRDVLPMITVPALLIHGNESHFYSVELGQYVRNSIPNAQLHVYEDADHSPHLGQRERFLSDLRKLASQE